MLNAAFLLVQLMQCLSDQKILAQTLWVAVGVLISVATGAGLFVQWILKQRIEFLKEQLELCEQARKSNVSVPAGYSFRRLVVSSLLMTVFVGGLAGGGVFLYYSARLRSTNLDLSDLKLENQKNDALLNPLFVTFGKDKVLGWPAKPGSFAGPLIVASADL